MLDSVLSILKCWKDGCKLRSKQKPHVIASLSYVVLLESKKSMHFWIFGYWYEKLKIATLHTFHFWCKGYFVNLFHFGWFHRQVLFLFFLLGIGKLNFGVENFSFWCNLITFLQRFVPEGTFKRILTHILHLSHKETINETIERRCINSLKWAFMKQHIMMQRGVILTLQDWEVQF